MTNSFDDKLEKVGLKKTKHRKLLLELIQKNDCLMSAEGLFLQAKEIDPAISLSTVYRTMEMFLEKELIRTVVMEQENKLLYEEAHLTHMHHLICTKCHKVIHLKQCPVKELETSIGKDYNFKVERHSLEFYGICEECQNQTTI